MSGVSVNREALRSALSLGMGCAIALLVIELARAAWSIVSAIAMMVAMQNMPDAPRPWLLPPVLIGYALTAAGLLLSVVLVLKLSSARRELDRQ